MVQREIPVASVYPDSEMSPRYRKTLVRLLADQARAELYAAHMYSKWVRKAPGPEEKMRVAELAYEETEHWYRTVKLLEELGIPADQVKAYAGNDWFIPVISLLAGRLRWIDILMMSFLIDQGAYFLVEDFTQSSYAPWCKVAHQILEDEVGHPEFGAHFLEEQIRKLGPRARAARARQVVARRAQHVRSAGNAPHAALSQARTQVPDQRGATPGLPRRHRARDREAGPARCPASGAPPIPSSDQKNQFQDRTARAQPWPKSRSKAVSSSSAVLRLSVRRCSTPARTARVLSPSANQVAWAKACARQRSASLPVHSPIAAPGPNATEWREARPRVERGVDEPVERRVARQRQGEPGARVRAEDGLRVEVRVACPRQQPRAQPGVEAPGDRPEEAIPGGERLQIQRDQLVQPHPTVLGVPAHRRLQELHLGSARVAALRVEQVVQRRPRPQLQERAVVFIAATRVRRARRRAPRAAARAGPRPADSRPARRPGCARSGSRGRAPRSPLA